MALALKLLVTGMGTVFFILIMVVFLGNVIIRITNKFAPIPVTSTVTKGYNNPGIEPTKLAAIISTVEISTKGKGKVTSIEKIKG